MRRDVLDVAVLLRPRACVLVVRDVERGGEGDIRRITPAKEAAS